MCLLIKYKKLKQLQFFIISGNLESTVTRNIVVKWSLHCLLIACSPCIWLFHLYTKVVKLIEV